jgi:integrase
MARPRTLRPKYRHHKSTGRAYIVIDGKTYYLGKYESPESRDEYDRLIGEWIGRGRAPLPSVDARDAGSRLTVSTLIAAWTKWARPRYGAAELPDGKRPKGELGNYWDILRELRRLYGNTAAVGFGPVQLEALRDALGQEREFTDTKTGRVVRRQGMSRKVINRHMSRVRRVFKWGVRKGLIPGEVHHKLCSVDALRYGEARETQDVAPVAETDVEAVLPFLSRHLRAMAELQLRGSMRPGEVCGMKWADIDTTPTSGAERLKCRSCQGQEPCDTHSNWMYRPTKHKTQHHGKARMIPLGPRAQAILTKFLPAQIDPAAYVFSPAQAEAERNAKRREENTKPKTASQLKRAEAAAERTRVRPPGERYDVAGYRRAIARACEKAFGMPDEFKPKEDDKPQQKQERATKRSAWHREHKWRPNQLRHTGATLTRKRFGLEATQQVLGHSSKRTTELYALPDVGLAAKVAAEMG